MARYATLSKDVTTTSMYMQGARKGDTVNSIARVVFQNYDDDSKAVYSLGEIAAMDHFGTNVDGYGDLRFSTCAGCNLMAERMRILNDGRVGVGTSNPSELFEVANGYLCVTGEGNGVVFKNGDGSVAGSVTNVGGVLKIVGKKDVITIPVSVGKISDSNWMVAGSWLYSPSVHGSIVGVTGWTHFENPITSSNYYAMRVVEIGSGEVLDQLSGLSNSDFKGWVLSNLINISSSNDTWIEVQVKKNTSSDGNMVVVYGLSVSVEV